MLTVDSVLRFGKHKGETLSDVMDDDPGYIVHLATHTDIVFDDGIVEACRAAVEGEPKWKN